jgi:glycosyltransferase involved in cell wall biosynthesis
LEMVEPNSGVIPAIRIFLMINNFETGGSERQFVELAKNIDKKAFQVHLGCLNRGGPWGKNLGDVPEFPLGGSLLGLTSMLARRRLSRHLRRSKIQVAHAFDFYTNLALIPAARLAGGSVVIGGHRQIGDLLTPAKFRAQALAFRWCDAVTCNSEAAAERLVKAGVAREKLFVIGNSVELEGVEPEKAAVPKTGKPRVGMVARMNAESKNHTGFLRIAAMVAAHIPDVEFLLAGDGPLRPKLERQAMELGLANQVIFLGDRRDIAEVLASLDVAVLTSTSESLSNAILEAMAVGLPVAAYDVGGNSELLNEQRGVLVAANDEDAFAAAIRRFLGDPVLRKQYGDNGRTFVEGRFRAGEVSKGYQDLYRLLLDKMQKRILA